jgi:hypothetical protein
MTDILRKMVLVFLFATIGFVWQAAAGPHPAGQPAKMDGMATCDGKGLVGNWIFSLQSIPFDEKNPQGLLPQLEFAMEQPTQEWFGRSYFLCTLKETMKAIPGKSRNYQLETRVTIVGENGIFFMSFVPVDKTMEDETWNTAGFDGSEMNHKLRELGKGTYQLKFFRQLDYEVPVQVGPDMRWEGRWIGLASGTLAVVVK